MAKLNQILMGLALLLCAAPLAAQSCYVQLDDATGVPLPPAQLSELEVAACELRDAFPEEFQSDFAVYDFGFYLHQEGFAGGVPEVFQAKVTEVEQESAYFLLFGRQLSRGGGTSEVWVEVRLPEGGSFECIGENEQLGLEGELTRLLLIESPSQTIYAEREVLAMEKLAGRIASLLNCCYSSIGFRAQPLVTDSANIDSALLAINLCIDNSCEREASGVVGVISPASYMPEVAFDLEYFGEPFCGNLTAVLEIRYSRVPSGASSRGRNDVTKDTIPHVKIGLPYVFNFADEELWGGTTWTRCSGGRARVAIYDGFGVFVKSFNFTIKGQNPKVERVYNYLDEEPYANVWFLKKLLTHESGSYPVLDLGVEMKQFNPYDFSQENLEGDWNAFSRCPNMSYDGGWGLGQHTVPMPHRQVLWDWKANVHYAYHLVAEETVAGEEQTKYSAVKSRLSNWISYIETWEANNPGVKIEGHDDFVHGGITWAHGVSEVISDIDGLSECFDEVLEDEKRSFIDAMLLKRYNGIGGGENDRDFYYLYISQNAIPEWRIDISAHYSSNVNYYVRSVAEQTVPDH